MSSHIVMKIGTSEENGTISMDTCIYKHTYIHIYIYIYNFFFVGVCRLRRYIYPHTKHTYGGRHIHIHAHICVRWFVFSYFILFFWLLLYFFCRERYTRTFTPSQRGGRTVIRVWRGLLFILTL